MRTQRHTHTHIHRGFHSPIAHAHKPTQAHSLRQWQINTQVHVGSTCIHFRLLSKTPTAQTVAWLTGFEVKWHSACVRRQHTMQPSLVLSQIPPKVGMILQWCCQELQQNKGHTCTHDSSQSKHFAQDSSQTNWLHKVQIIIIWL